MSKWQPQASSIWKPVAVRSHRHSNSKVHHHSGPAGLIKSRNSPINSTLHSKPPKLLSGSTNSINRAINNSSNNYPTSGYGGLAKTVSQLQHRSELSPTVHVFTGIDTSGSVPTPPESPQPRPAPASSGFYDSSASQTSITSLNVSWTEGCFRRTSTNQGCFSPYPPRSTSASSFQSFQRRSDGFPWVRSLSVEEPISVGEETMRANSSSSEVLPPSEQTIQQRSLNASPRPTRSMPVINLNLNSNTRCV